MEQNKLKLNNEFPFTKEDFENLRGLLTGHTGIELTESKMSLMYSRLVRRLRKLNIKNFSDYHNHVQSTLKKGDDGELMAMINAITTNVTHFFREEHHFTHLAENLEAAVEKFGKIRIWSSAASIGAEPWSIAMVVDKFKLDHPSADIKIIATDIDSVVLETCEKGIYNIKPEDVKKNKYLSKYLTLINEDSDDSPITQNKNYKVDKCLKKYVTFQKLNLLDDWNKILSPSYHFVFCRNVIIYFSKDTQRALFVKMEKHMPEGSILYIGHSESLINVSEGYKSFGHTTYERLANA